MLFISCSTLPQVRKFENRRYRPCQDFEAEDPIGKFCFRYCVKYKFLRKKDSINCKIWKTDIKDFSKKDDFLAFRNSGFVIINEMSIK